MSLNPSHVPEPLKPLLFIAEKWGMGDDFEREEALNQATSSELEALVHSIDDIADDDLYSWLAGKESYSSNPSAEYLAFTNLTLAIDSAKEKLKKLGAR